MKRKQNWKLRNKKKTFKDLISKVSGDLIPLSNITSKIGSGATPLGGEGSYKTKWHFINS